MFFGYINERREGSWWSFPPLLRLLGDCFPSQRLSSHFLPRLVKVQRYRPPTMAVPVAKMKINVFMSLTGVSSLAAFFLPFCPRG